MSRCYAASAPEEGPPLTQNGTITLQAHQVGWIVTAIFTIIATVTSGWLVNKHLRWYTNKREQRYIVRILFMVPIYATISLASYLFWNHSTPLLLIRDGYESVVLTAFFYLLLAYLSPYPDEQKVIFCKVGLSRQADREARNRGEPERKWLFPLGFVKRKPEDGLYFLQVMKWGVLQYIVIRPTTTLVAVILNYIGLYCESSWQPKWGYIYLTVIVSTSVTIAMYCLLQLYVTISQDIAPRKPLLKLFLIKAVVFLTFWQATFLSLLSTFGVIKDTRYMTAADINIGIAAILETFEMMVFAFVHIYAFTYKPYCPPHHPSSRAPPPIPTPRLRSLGHALDFRETIREIWKGCVYVADRMRGREPTSDRGARRVAHLGEVFGRTRPGMAESARTMRTLGVKEREKGGRVGALEVEVVKRVDVEVEGEWQWLSLGDDYGYGLGNARGEKSDCLGVQIEKELLKRGYEGLGQGPTPTASDHMPVAASSTRRRSLWRTIYDRISNDLEPGRLTRSPSRRSGWPSRDVNGDHGPLLAGTDYTYEDLPPPSMLCMYPSQRGSSAPSQFQEQSHNVPEAGIDATVPMAAYDPAKFYQRQQHHHDWAQSPRLQSPPPDSVLGRIFPAGTEPPLTELGHNSAQSILSSSARGCSPRGPRAARSTPRSSLAPATPLILSQVQDSAPRYQSDKQVVTENLHPAMSAQIFGSPIVHSPPSPASGDHTIAGPISSLAPPVETHRDLDLTPISVPQTSPPVSQTPAASPLHPAPGLIPPQPPRLRRSSALTSNPSKRPRRQSLPVPPPAPSAFPGPTARRYPANHPTGRRISAPIESIPQHYVPLSPLPSHLPSSSRNRTSPRNRYSMASADRHFSAPSNQTRTTDRQSGVPGRENRGGRRSELLLPRTGLVMPEPLEPSSFSRPTSTPAVKAPWIYRPTRNKIPATDKSQSRRSRP